MNRPSGSDNKFFFLAATGMVTPLGANTAMTAAAVKASVSAYTLSDYYNHRFQPIKVTAIPPAFFAGQGIDATDWTGTYTNRVALMASFVVEQLFSGKTPSSPIPLILGMPDATHEYSVPGSSLISYLAKQFPALINPSSSRSIHSGRAAGMDALAFAFDYLYELPLDFILIGSSDSQLNDQRLTGLDKADRLLAINAAQGFAPGEAASFLLLTRNPEQALVVNGNRIVLYPPGIADETGHLFSDEPYRGDGLDQAFKKALIHSPETPVHNIYSSMNGEHHWAKEYGVAYMRSRSRFIDPIKIEHPADCYGDIGSATAPVLIALAAHDLLTSSTAYSHLVYSSSDTARRGAIVIKKVAAI